MTFSSSSLRRTLTIKPICYIISHLSSNAILLSPAPSRDEPLNYSPPAHHHPSLPRSLFHCPTPASATDPPERRANCNADNCLRELRRSGRAAQALLQQLCGSADDDHHRDADHLLPLRQRQVGSRTLVAERTIAPTTTTSGLETEFRDRVHRVCE